MLRKLTFYHQIAFPWGHDAYFDPIRRADAIVREEKVIGPIEKMLDQAVESAKKGRTRLYVTRANLLHGEPGTGRPDPLPETVVRLGASWVPAPGWEGDDERECMRRYRATPSDFPSDFIVKDDLSDIDQKRTGAVYYGASNWNMLLFYEGKEYLVSYSPSGNGFTVMRDAHDGGYVGPICSIIHTQGETPKGKRK